MPITFNFMSPVLIIFAGFEATINFSFILFGVWFISSLFLGRSYCAYVCQWGAIQEIYGDVKPKKLDRKKKKRNSWIKYVVFAVWITFVILGPVAAGGWVNGLDLGYPNQPGDIQWVSFDAAAAGSLVFYFGIQIGIVILFCGFAGTRGFCRYACPMAVLGIIGTKIKNAFKYPSLHLEADTEKCSGCKRCTRACAMSLEVSEMVAKKDMTDNDCILCGLCINECPNDVIRYAWRWNAHNTC